MTRAILKENIGFIERSRSAITLSNEDLLLTVPSKKVNGANQPSGLTQDFRTKVLANLIDEDEHSAVPYTRTETVFLEDRMPIREMVEMMLKKEQKTRKRLKPTTPFPKAREFPKLYSSTYRGRISVWLREFCKDHNLSMTVFFKASQFLDVFLQHERVWKQFIVKKLTDDDLYLMSLVALMIASKFGSMTLAVPQLSRLTGKPRKTFIMMELDMLNLATDPGIEDSSYVYNAVTYNHYTWPAIRRALESKLGQKLRSMDRAVSKLLFRRKIDFALHRVHLDMHCLAGVRSSIIAIATIDAVMLEAGLKSDKQLWGIFKADRSWPFIKEVNKKMRELLQEKNFCDILAAYKKRWATEDMKKNKYFNDEDDVKNEEYQKKMRSGYDALEEPRQEENKINAN